MQKIAYSPWRLVTTMAAALAMTGLCLWVYSATGHTLMLVGGVLFAVCCAITVWGLLVNRPALVFDERQVTVNTLITSKTVPWSQVRDIRVETTSILMWGFIPIGKQDHIIFDTAGGLFGSKRLGVSAKLLVAPTGVAGVCAALAAARLGSVAAPTAAKRPAGAVEAEVPPSTFNPDAAIARYLAQKAQQEAQQAPSAQAPVRRQFGKRGL